MPHARVVHIPLSDRTAFSLAEVSGLTGLSISGLYLLINRGELRSARVGGRRLVTREALEQLLNSNPSQTGRQP